MTMKATEKMWKLRSPMRNPLSCVVMESIWRSLTHTNIVGKNPDGSLAQAALMQGALSKERRDTKIQQQREKESGRERGVVGNTGSRMHDPMAPSNNRAANEDDEGPTNQRAKDMPEWMKHVTAGGKQPTESELI
uniref:Uncharacterized protein n=1 Tax=Ditylenchus dipsaci TaxID=166011 RepID=A0A915DZX1_9BILA